MLHILDIPIDVIRVNLFDAIIDLGAKTTHSAIIVFRPSLGTNDINRFKARFLRKVTLFTNLGDTITYQLYPNYKVEGEYTIVDELGILLAKYTYINGLRQGMYTKYHNSNGKLYVGGYYKDGLKHGPYKRYYDNGVLMCIRHYINGKIHGRETRFDEYGRLVKQYRFKHGKKNGICRLYSITGQITKVKYYRQGVNQGMCLTYHSNGALNEMFIYKDNRIHGKYEKYDLTGKLKVVQYYNMGILEGPSIKFNHDIGLWIKSFYVGDLVRGEVTRYRECISDGEVNYVKRVLYTT